jgi:hypothetical protein
MKRTLSLKKESLLELSTDELIDVVGGTTPISRTCTPLTITCVPCVIVVSVLQGCLP